jgi:hypothetical protein
VVSGPGEDGPGPAAPAPVEWVDLGEIGGGSSADMTEEIGDAPVGPGWESRRGPPRPAVVVVALLVALAVVAAVLRHGDDTKAAAARPGAAASGPTPGPGATSHDDLGPAAVPAEVRARPRVVRVPAHLLGVRSGWELFGLGQGVVARLEPAAGRLTLTRIPQLASDGPVSFLASGSAAIVRPLDEVSGYVVPDGESVRGLLGLLRSGGLALPGPDPQHVWLDGGDDRRTSMVLAGQDGTAGEVRLVIPATALGPVFADGEGYVLFSGIGGVYDVRPSGMERVTAGTPVAVGGGRILAVECDDQYRCSTVVLGLTDGSRRVIAVGFPPTYSLGAIAPDGSIAAVPDDRPDGGLGLQLFDLRTGHSTRVALDLGQGGLAGGAVAWSPDSRLLFALDVTGTVHVVDPHRGSVRGLGVALPPLSQLAIRAPVASTG